MNTQIQPGDLAEIVNANGRGTTDVVIVRVNRRDQQMIVRRADGQGGLFVAGLDQIRTVVAGVGR